jgi:hypothetical protein
MPIKKFQSPRKLSDHDKVVTAIAKMFLAYGFDVKYTVKGVRRIETVGDSGVTYYPDFVAHKGIVTIVGDVRTRGQRGLGDKTDRGAIQMLQAQLDDLNTTLRRPHGVIANPNGTEDDAKQLAEHFGIIILDITTGTVNTILGLDLEKDKREIIEEARKLGITF